MPNVAGREFPYTPQGMAAAEQYKQSLGMRGGGMMGFRPVGYRDGDLVEDSHLRTYQDLLAFLKNNLEKDKEAVADYIYKKEADLEMMAKQNPSHARLLEFAKQESNFAGFMERIMQGAQDPVESIIPAPKRKPPRPSGLGDPVSEWSRFDRPEFGRSRFVRPNGIEEYTSQESMPGYTPQESVPPGIQNPFGDWLKAEPFRPPMNPSTGLPWTGEERGPMRRVPRSGGINPETGESYPGRGYHTGDESGMYGKTLEYVKERDELPEGFLRNRGGYVGRGMRNGGMMGFRPVGYQDGDLVEDPYAPSLYQGGIDSSEFLPGGPITPLVATGMGRTMATRMAEGAPGGDGGMSKAVDAVSSLVQEFMAQGVPDIAKKVTNSAVATFGLPVDLVNAILKSLGVPVSDTPIGGSRNLIETFGFPGDQEAVTRSFSIDPLVSAGAGARFAEDRAIEAPTELRGVAGGPITPLVATGAGAAAAAEALQGASAGTGIPYGMRHGGIMSLRRR